MNIPYTFHYGSAPREVVEKPGKHSRYPFATATHHRHLIFPTADFIIQQLDFPPFFIELFELKAEDTFPLSYEVFSRQYFLFFMLEGSVTFTTSEGFYVSHAKSGHFAFAYNDKGKYVLDLPSGRYTALCIAYHPDWLHFFTEDQPVLNNFLLKNRLAEHTMLPYCRIDRGVGRWLRSHYSELQKGRGSLDGQLRYYISLILERYNQLAEAKLQTLPWQVKEYLDINFSFPELSIKYLTERLKVSKEQLRGQFQAEFKVSPHHYYTCKRLALARKLISTHNLPLRKIFHEAGYNDESALRYEMKQFGLLK